MTEIREPRPDDEPALLVLNNAHRVELSELTAGGLRQMFKDAWRVRIVDDDGEADGAGATSDAAVAMIVAFDQDTTRDSANYRWFHERFRRFVYIDRVVVSPDARGRGLAKRLYKDVIAAAREADQTVVCAEVNVEPPNPASHALHESLGFSKVSDETAADEKIVRYYIYEL